MAVTHVTAEPYRVTGSRIAFTNWNFVRPCQFHWADDQGRNVSVRGDQGPNEAHFVRSEDPVGIQIVVRPAERRGPILREEHPWEAGGAGVTTILKEGGIYRAWAGTGWGDLRSRGRKFTLYYESDDGMNWRRPNLGLVEIDGSRDNNALNQNPLGAVFIDPSAPPDERYKSLSEQSFPPEQVEEYKRARNEPIDPRAFRTDVQMTFGLRGAVSPDGLRWTFIDRPLLIEHTDTQVIAYYDVPRQRYVAYLRDWAVGPQADVPGLDPKTFSSRWIGPGRRSISRTESPDFRSFPMSRMVLEPHPEMSPSQVFYTNCRTTIPDAPDSHLMFPTVWDQSTDATHLVMAVSRDGELWSLLNHSLLKTGPFGEFDGGCLFAGPNLIELPNGDFALPYTGYDVPHKYPRARATRALGYAIWPKGRLIGIEAAGHGAFSTPAFVPNGSRLLLNATSKRAGHVRVELTRLDGTTIPGREFENSVPLVGDCHRAPVRWKAHEDTGVATGEPIRMRFRLEQATVYFIDFT